MTPVALPTVTSHPVTCGEAVVNHIPVRSAKSFQVYFEVQSFTRKYVSALVGCRTHFGGMLRINSVVEHPLLITLPSLLVV